MIREFNTLQELIDYLPHCIICGKNMILYCSGIMKTGYKDIYKGGYNLCLELFKKDDFFVAKNSKVNFVINSKDNKIIEGTDIVNQFMTSRMYVTTKCKTCRCYTRSLYNKGCLKYPEFFPKIPLVEEELGFTLSKGKNISIVNSSWGPKLESVNRHIIMINASMLDLNLDLEFSKIKNLSHLIKKINMILTFH